MMVKLKKREISFCRQLATGRTQFSRMSGVANARKDQSRTDLEIDLLGAKAELAVSKLLQLDHDFSLMGVDDGTDMFHGDVSIDVKSTFYGHGCMLFKSVANFKADVCILATATEDESIINVVGWLPRAVFKVKAQPFNKGGYSTGAAVEQKDLLDMRDLWHGLMTKYLNGS